MIKSNYINKILPFRHGLKLLIIGFIFLAISSCSKNQNLQSKTETWPAYTNNQYLFSIKYPPDWEVKKYKRMSFFVSFIKNSKKEFNPNITLMADSITASGGMSLEEFAKYEDRALTFSSPFINLKINSSQKVIIKKQEALYREGQYEIQGIPLEFSQYILFSKNHLYTMTYTTFKGNLTQELSLFKASVDSFSILLTSSD